MVLSSETKGRTVKRSVDYMVCDGCQRQTRLTTTKNLDSGWFRVHVFPVGNKQGVWFDICQPACLQLCELPAKVRNRSYAKSKRDGAESSGEEHDEVS